MAECQEDDSQGKSRMRPFDLAFYMLECLWVVVVGRGVVFLCFSFCFVFLLFLKDGVSPSRPGWSSMAGSRLTATSTPRVPVILLPQPPKSLRLQASATTPG